INHTHVPPEYARPQTGSERLRAGFLGGEALCIRLRASGAAFGFRTLGGGEDASEEPLAVPLHRSLDPTHVDEIRPDAEYHVRPRSIAARMALTASARPQETASPIRKCPMLSSMTSGNAAIASAVAKFRPWPAWTSRPRRRANCAPWRMRRHSASAAGIRFSATASHHAPV